MKEILKALKKWKYEMMLRRLLRQDREAFDRAKEFANHRFHTTNGKTQYVIKGRNGYKVMAAHEIPFYKKTGVLKKSVNYMDLRTLSCYIKEKE